MVSRCQSLRILSSFFLSNLSWILRYLCLSRWTILWGQCVDGGKSTGFSWRRDTLCWWPYLHGCQHVKGAFKMEDSSYLPGVGEGGKSCLLGIKGCLLRFITYGLLSLEVHAWPRLRSFFGMHKALKKWWWTVIVVARVQKLAFVPVIKLQFLWTRLFLNVLVTYHFYRGNFFLLSIAMHSPSILWPPISW